MNMGLLKKGCRGYWGKGLFVCPHLKVGGEIIKMEHLLQNMGRGYGGKGLICYICSACFKRWCYRNTYVFCYQNTDFK